LDVAFTRDPQQRYLYVADGINNRVYILLRDSLEVLTTFGDGGRQPSQFYGVHSLATDSKGNVYTTERYDVPFSAPAARMQELVALLRGAFAAQGGGGFRFEGEFWNINVPIYGRPHAARATIPIWVAAVNRGMIGAAGAAADGLVGHPIATRRWHREVTLTGLREAESKAGREAGACALKPYVMTSIQPSREDAVRDAKQQIGFYFTTALYHTILDLHGLRDVGEKCRNALRRFDIGAMADAIPDELVDEIAIACTPDEARDRLAQWKDLTDEPLLYAPTIGVPADRVRGNLDAMLDLFGNV
jgi:alkanesulfonate monooxygenase SsuD/methylene tetrahydromethanopterin reductase-like flavin-dependent oxidoreductase (luciferase family)